ncbi:ABC transporter ATP-binding protein [Lederbergia sp. NSJ-179]|uniref:ATP-binding cassette domain-containing protein n=1 Tax=Lederbergia sp. NSJ-179 TaxID=2931402 RepID=UPI001FD24712|nr:ABC transporter ATP-binding protein [Lederbergia sp. NSJ-179]MCJ7841991.1 ABC transporter ATP-binding protein [Lederbergia sp. NSJ-179]
MGEIFIEATDVSKEIDGQTILNQLSFRLEGNKAIAIRGQNGSGKSTFLKLLAGIYEPTNGIIKRGKYRIGYVPEHFPETLPFRLNEYLSIIASFHGNTKPEMKSTLSSYIRLFSIESFLDTPLKKCSKGTRQKVGLIQALMINPDILLLDEPLTGLDHDSQHHLLQLLEKRKKKCMIIFTTHEDRLIEKIADESYLLESGTLSISKMKSLKKKRIKINYRMSDILQDLDLITHDPKEKIAILSVDPDQCDALLLHLLQNHCSILEVGEEERT